MKALEEMNDLEFGELLRSCLERLKKENDYHTYVQLPFSDCLIIIDKDEEVNDQIPLKPKGWIDFTLMLNFSKHIPL